MSAKSAQNIPTMCLQLWLDDEQLSVKVKISLHGHYNKINQERSRRVVGLHWTLIIIDQSESSTQQRKLE